MAVNVHIHKVYRSFTDGLETVEVEGHTVGESLDNLVTHYPDIKRVIFATNGDWKEVERVTLQPMDGIVLARSTQ